MAHVPSSETLDELLETLWTARERGLKRLPFPKGRGKIDLDREGAAQLVKAGLAQWGKKEGEELVFTPKGEERARVVVRTHRVTDVLLFYALGMRDHNQREAITCSVEHALLPELLEGICTLLGHPTHSPEGEPIPSGACCREAWESMHAPIVPLTRVKPGECARVVYINSSSQKRLSRLSGYGLLPGSSLTLIMNSPAIVVELEGAEIALDRMVAEEIHVARMVPKEISPQGGNEPEKKGFFTGLLGQRRHRGGRS